MEISGTHFAFWIFVNAGRCLSVCVMETFTLWIMVSENLTPIKLDLRRVSVPGEAGTVREQISKHNTGHRGFVTPVSKLGVAWTMGGFVLFVILERGWSGYRCEGVMMVMVVTLHNGLVSRFLPSRETWHIRSHISTTGHLPLANNNEYSLIITMRASCSVTLFSSIHQFSGRLVQTSRTKTREKNNFF